MEYLTEFAQFVQAVVQTAGAVAVAVIAGLALNTWRRQLKGQTRFDTAKRLLIASHEFAQKFHGARNTFIAPSEYPSDYVAIVPNERTTADERRAYTVIFNARWKPLGDCYANIEGLLPEVRALLSDDVAEAANRLLDCARNLKHWMGVFVWMLETYPHQDPNSLAAQLVGTQQEARDGVFAPIPQPGVEIDNKLTIDLIARQSELVAALKPYIEIE